MSPTSRSKLQNQKKGIGAPVYFMILIEIPVGSIRYAHLHVKPSDTTPIWYVFENPRQLQNLNGQ